MKRDAVNFRIGILLVGLIITAAIAMAGEMRKAFTATIPTNTATVSRTFSETDVGADDLNADLLGGILNVAAASTATVDVSVVTSDASTNTITNAIASVAMAGLASKAWAPATAIVVTKGERIVFGTSVTTEPVNVRFWIK